MLDQYRETQQKIAAFRARDHDPQVSALLKAPKQPFRTALGDAVEVLEPLRKLSRHALQLQDKMLALLPPEFHQALLKTLYESEALGNWDYANHERANVGFVIRDGKLAGATAVDFGVCGHTGFSGKPKTESGASIAIPARVDDPFLTLPARRAKDSEHLPGAVLGQIAATPDQIADSYYQRFQAIVQRAALTELSGGGRRKSV